MDATFIENLLNLKFVFGILMFVIWIGYLVFAIAVVGKTRVLAKILKTSLSGVNVFASWMHLVVVLVVGVIGLIMAFV